MKPHVKVATALIFEDGKFLICQRPKHKACGLLWEVVGGKLEKGESHKEALIRECKEELGVLVSVGDVYFEVIHEYDDAIVEMVLFKAKIESGVPMLLEHNDIKWILPKEIPNFSFCPADKDILEKIMRENNG